MRARDRIKEFRRVKASDLVPNPRNWRQHGEAQREAMRGVLEEIGYAGALLARETPEGLVLIDGHLRRDMTPDQEVPVLILDVTEAEADQLLAIFDPLSAMAHADEEALQALLADVHFESDALTTLLATLGQENQGDTITGGWDPLEDTRRGTALETVGYDLTGVWPRDGDEATRVYPHMISLPRQPGQKVEAFRRRYSRSPALEMERIVRTYMRPGDHFLEVCAGWFTFSLSAAVWGYNGDGVDIWPTSLAFGRRQLKRLSSVEGAGRYRVVEGDAMALPYEDATFDFVYCNPPFYQLERYSQDARDLSGRASYQDWLADSGRMMVEMRRVAEPGALIVTVMADFRQGGKLWAVHSDWIAEGQRRGLELHDLVVQTMRTEQVRIWRKHYDRRRTIKAHEYVVVFRTPGGDALTVEPPPPDEDPGQPAEGSDPALG